MRGPIGHCAIVIPARDEEALLGRCLTAAQAAREQLAIERPEISTTIILVLDSCVDGSATVASTFADVIALSCRAGSVGVARRIACAFALSKATVDPADCWLACTDADSAVPLNWLTAQVRLAEHGADLVLGTVVPDYHDRTGVAFTDWLDDYPQADGHPYVHGANLGIRGDMYQRAGGFPAMSLHEDVSLAESVRSAGGRVHSTAACAVLTSGRHDGRTSGGFAGWMTERFGQVSLPAAARTDVGPRIDRLPTQS